MESVDLSQLAAQLSEEDQANLAQMASEQPIQAVTAFVVYLTPEGQWNATTNIDQVFEVAREVTPDDLTAACAVVARDVIIQHTAAQAAKITTVAVIQNMMAISQQAAEQQELQKVEKIISNGRRR